MEGTGVGVRSFLARRGASGVVVKIDASNAFNSISRAAIGDAVARHSPLLGGYFAAAYAAPTHLFWGERVISSSCGVQQGYPQGLIHQEKQRAAELVRAHDQLLPLE